MNSQLSHTHWEIPKIRRTPVEPRKVMAVLAICMTLQMTGFVLLLPLFAQRLEELGAGAGTLASSSMAYAIAGTLAAPCMGWLADRFGRKPLIIAALAAYFTAFVGFGIARAPIAFILLRGAAGLFSAGLMPAMLGIVADLAPADRKGSWIGIVAGGGSIGWIVGPILGGFLFDHWGFEVALMTSIGIAFITLALVILMVPETNVGNRSLLTGAAVMNSDRRHGSLASRFQNSLKALPKPLTLFALLLVICFLVAFAWSYIEPSFMFYAYDDLMWSPSMLGMVMSVYGIAMTTGEFTLSRLSDRLGRKPVIVIGLILFSAQFAGLALSRNSILISISFAIAGLGNALFDPALSASILDITPAGRQAAVLGIKSSISSLGNILGPSLAILIMPLMDANRIFLSATAVVALTVLVSLAIGKTKSANPGSSQVSLVETAP